MIRSRLVGMKHSDSVPFEVLSPFETDQITAINFFVQDFVKGLQVTFTNHESEAMVRDDVRARSDVRVMKMDLEPLDYIVRVMGKSGFYIDGMRLETLKKRDYVAMPSQGGRNFHFAVRPCYEMCGIQGSYGGDLHEFGLIVRRSRRDFRHCAPRLARDLLRRLKVVFLLAKRSELGAFARLGSLPLLEICQWLIDDYYSNRGPVALVTTP
jgi:hypothetical protein